MSYTALYRAFRPKTFQEVVGQEHIKTTLKNQIKSGRVGHAYLLNGTRGTGKTSIAKILARAVNCENLQDGEPCNECEICKAILDGSLTDVVEMDAASNNSVEDIREIRNEVNFLPTRAKYRVYIIDEVHMLSTGAFNALLKTLEEPPEHVKFILATTEPQKIPATILSRCQRFDFKKISNENIEKRLKFVCEQNKINISDDALKLIAVLSEGAMRDALSILERCIQDGEDNINVDKIKDLVGIPKLTFVHNILKAIIEKNVENAINEIDNVISEGKDITNFLWEMIKYTKDILVAKIGKKLEIYNRDELEDIIKLAEEASKEELFNIIFRLSEMETRLKQASQKTIIFQAEIIILCMGNNQKDLETRIDKIEKLLNGKSIEINQKSINIPQKQDVLTPKKMEISHIQETEIKKTSEQEAKQKKQENIDTDTLKNIDFWSKILGELKENGKLMIYANLLNTRAVELNDMTIGIEFPGGLNDFRRKLLEKNENMQEIQRLVSIEYGKEMQIKLIDKPTKRDTDTKEIKSKQVEEKKENNINSLDDLADLGLSVNYIDE